MNKKISIVLMLLLFALVFSAKDAHALWGSPQKESKLDKDAYETLVKKNLDLRNEVDRLVKEQEQLRSIYKILLEKVKTLQRDNAKLSEQLKPVQKKSPASANTIVAEPYTEPESNAPDDRAKGLQEGILANKDIIEQQSEKIRSQEERISALESELGSFKVIFDTAALKKNYPEAFIGREDAAKFMASRPVKRVREEVDKLNAKQKVKNEQVSALDKEMEKSRADQNELKGRIDSAAINVSGLKDSVANINADIKSEGEQAQAEQDRIKGLEGSIDKVTQEQRDIDIRLQDAAKMVSQAEESIRKAAAVPAPKGSPAGFKSEEVKSLEKDLEKASGDEKDLRQKMQDAEVKISDLKQAIKDTLTRSEENIARAESKKERIAALKKDIAAGEAKEIVLKKDLQRLMKKTDVIKRKRATLTASIEAEDARIRDLKKIIEKQMLGMYDTGGLQGEGVGPAAEAQSTLSMLNNRIRELRSRNEELEKSLKRSEKSGDRPLRNNELPTDVKRKLDKERLDMHYNLAIVYDQNKMYKDAEREYLKCLDINSNDPDVIYNLGILYDDKLNDNHKAAGYYKKYLEVRPMGESATQVRIWLTDIELEQRIGREVR